ncbi:beta family protein, partial [Aeromonas media]|uniref:beta family protein n=1 Tax=Aeromonas media TaxID=651 RepID=UPI00223F5615
DKILPIYELTKSRKCVKAPDGDIFRRMQQIKKIQDGRPFILDLTTDEKYINTQIKQLLSERDGFWNWRHFFNESHRDLNIIPMVHIYEDDDRGFEDVINFVRDVSSYKQHLAVRLPHDLDEDEIHYYLTPVINSLSENCKLYVFLDAGYIRKAAKESLSDVSNKFIRSVSAASSFARKIEDLVVLSTSFPSSPATEGGHDSDGLFTIYEESIYHTIKEVVPNVKYGDYASINTEQIEMKGGTFVPRIDIALKDGNTFIYKRHRRNEGSYVKCAKEVLIDPRYKNYDGWSDTEIFSASEDSPSGISPAYWISVRMHYYITTRVILRSFS